MDEKELIIRMGISVVNKTVASAAEVGMLNGLEQLDILVGSVVTVCREIAKGAQTPVAEVFEAFFGRVVDINEIADGIHRNLKEQN